MVTRIARLMVTVLLSVIVVTSVVWSVLALWLDGPGTRVLAGSMGAAAAFTSLLLVALVRPFLRGLLAALLPIFLVALWWVSLAPGNSRQWTPDVARAARATFDGNRVTIENVRHFKYRSESDYDQHWETRAYNLDRICGLDLFLSFLGADPHCAYDRQLGIR